jgi:hypothetical protein
VRVADRVLPRNLAEGVALFVAVVLGVGAVAAAVQADAGLAASNVSAEVDDVETSPTRPSARRSGRDDAFAPPSSVAVLGRVPASTDAPLASAGTGTRVTTETRTGPGGEGSARSQATVSYNPWLGG